MLYLIHFLQFSGLQYYVIILQSISKTTKFLCILFHVISAVTNSSVPSWILLTISGVTISFGYIKKASIPFDKRSGVYELIFLSKQNYSNHISQIFLLEFIDFSWRADFTRVPCTFSCISGMKTPPNYLISGIYLKSIHL